MSHSIRVSANGGARDDVTWDRDCTTAAGILLVAGGVAAFLRGQAPIGEVCSTLGAVFLAVAAGLWMERPRRAGASSAPQSAPAEAEPAPRLPTS